MAVPFDPRDPIDPDDPTDARRLTAQQRCDEVAALLARGVRRLLPLRADAPAAAVPPPPQMDEESGGIGLDE